MSETVSVIFSGFLLLMSVIGIFLWITMPKNIEVLIELFNKNLSEEIRRTKTKPISFKFLKRTLVLYYTYQIFPFVLSALFIGNTYYGVICYINKIGSEKAVIFSFLTAVIWLRMGLKESKADVYQSFYELYKIYKKGYRFQIRVNCADGNTYIQEYIKRMPVGEAKIKNSGLHRKGSIGSKMNISFKRIYEDGGE